MTLCLVFLKELFEKVVLKKVGRQQQKHENMNSKVPSISTYTELKGPT